jgi:DNA-directed RNA polymerase specialized sigma24 family protein
VRLEAASGFREVAAAESPRLARLGGLLTGSRERGRELAEFALARALLQWGRLREEEPGGALRRLLFEVYGQWWRRRLRRYPPPGSGPEESCPEKSGPEKSGPEKSGPEKSGPEKSGPEKSGPEKSGPERWLAGVSPRRRAVALLTAEGRSQTETARLLGLSERAVARSRPDPPQPELATALSAADEPVPMDRVVARATGLRRRRRVTAGVVSVLALAALVPVAVRLRLGPGPDQAGALCPSQLPATVGSADGGRAGDLAGTLVPFTPARVAVCRYGPDGQQAGARAVDPVAAAVWVGALNAAPAVTGREVCSREPAEPFLVRLSGAGRTVTVRAEPRGCGQVTNGVRVAAAGRDLLWQIATGQTRPGPEPAALACAGAGGAPGNDGAGLTGRLVGFAASRVVVCPGSAGGSAAALDGPAARSLAARLDLAPALTGSTSGCPSPRRLAVVLTGGVQRVDLSVDTSGCGWANNGRRVARLDQASRRALLRLARVPAA